jgi:hypothetical protein
MGNSLPQVVSRLPEGRIVTLDLCCQHVKRINVEVITEWMLATAVGLVWSNGVISAFRESLPAQPVDATLGSKCRGDARIAGSVPTTALPRETINKLIFSASVTYDAELFQANLVVSVPVLVLTAPAE